MSCATSLESSASLPHFRLGQVILARRLSVIEVSPHSDRLNGWLLERSFGRRRLSRHIANRGLARFIDSADAIPWSQIASLESVLHYQASSHTPLDTHTNLFTHLPYVPPDSRASLSPLRRDRWLVSSPLPHIASLLCLFPMLYSLSLLVLGMMPFGHWSFHQRGRSFVNEQ